MYVYLYDYIANSVIRLEINVQVMKMVFVREFVICILKSEKFFNSHLKYKGKNIFTALTLTILIH